MTAIISARVVTIKDVNGVPFVDGWFLVEYREQYNTGGIAFDFSPYFRAIDQGHADMASGTRMLKPLLNEVDLPVIGANVASARIQAFTPNASGGGVSIASGAQIFLSGTFLSGQTSGLTLAILFSGQVVGADRDFSEVLSGTQLSGVRARVHLIGY